MYDDKIRCRENNVKDTIRVMAMKRLSNRVATAYLQILFRKQRVYTNTRAIINI